MTTTVADAPALTSRPRMSPARALQRTLQLHEKAIDETIASGGDVLAQAVRLSLLVGTDPGRSQPVLDQLLASLQACSVQRTAMINAHRAMDAIAKTINFRELGYGDGVEKDDVYTAPFTAASPATSVAG